MQIMRLDGNAVVEIAEIPEGSEIVEFYPEALGFVPWVEGVEVGHIKSGQTFAAPASPARPPLAARKADAMRMVIPKLDAIAAPVLSAYPVAEVASWSLQETEARAVAANASSPAPLLDALRGSATKAAYAARVLAKAEAFRAILAGVKAKRDSAEAAINGAATHAALDAAMEAVLADIEAP